MAIAAAAAALLTARRTRTPLAARVAPADLVEADRIQDQVAAALGGIGGWKVGAASATATPACGPMPRGGLHTSPARLKLADFFFVALEAEIAFRFGRAIDSAHPSMDEVLGAVESVHAGIEIVDSRYQNWRSRSGLEQAADCANHGAYVLGPASRASTRIDQTQQLVELWIGGTCVVSKTGGNTAGDVQRLLHWLARRCHLRGSPIRPGDVVTTGSCTGLVVVKDPVRVEARLPGVGSAELVLE